MPRSVLRGLKRPQKLSTFAGHKIGNIDDCRHDKIIRLSVGGRHVPAGELNINLVRRLTEPAVLEPILNQDWPWAGFAIGDLEPAWIERCEWWHSAKTVVLLFDGLNPRLICHYGDTSGLASIPTSVNDERIWANVRPDSEDIFWRFYRPDKVVRMRRMYLDRPVARTGDAVRLSVSNRREIEDLLKQGEWVLFQPHALSSGHYYGI